MTCHAVGATDLTVTEHYVSGGADVGAANGKGQTALHLAVNLNRVEAVQLLCENGAQSWRRDAHGVTALMGAAEHGLDKILAILLRHGHSAAAEHHRLPARGVTPMMLACAGSGGQPGHLSVLRLLLAAGESVLDTTVHLQSALHMAAYYNHFDAATLLLLGGSLVNGRTVQGDTPLHCAAHHGNTDLVVLLLQWGADPNNLTDHGKTALHSAMYAGSGSCIAATICGGADIRTRDRHGRALIDYLAHQSVAVTRSVEHIVDIPNLRDDFGNGLLHLAARADNYALAHFLCASGAANPNSTNTVGDTPLHEAVREVYSDVVEVLIRSEASIYIPNRQGDSALDLSRRFYAGGLETNNDGQACCRAVQDRHAYVGVLLAVQDMEVQQVRESIGPLLCV
jgi:ankyrin repeat protein